MRIIRIAMNYGYGSWISPSGEVTEVGEVAHALESVILTKEYYPELWDEDEYYIGEFQEEPHATVKELMNRGWVHVRHSPCNIGYKGSLSLPAKKAVFKVINQDEEDHVYISNGVNSTPGPVTRLDARRFIMGVL